MDPVTAELHQLRIENEKLKQDLELAEIIIAQTKEARDEWYNAWKEMNAQLFEDFRKQRQQREPFNKPDHFF